MKSQWMPQTTRCKYQWECQKVKSGRVKKARDGCQANSTLLTHLNSNDIGLLLDWLWSGCFTFNIAIGCFVIEYVGRFSAHCEESSLKMDVVESQRTARPSSSMSAVSPPFYTRSRILSTRSSFLSLCVFLIVRFKSDSFSRFSAHRLVTMTSFHQVAFTHESQWLCNEWDRLGSCRCIEKLQQKIKSTMKAKC